MRQLFEGLIRCEFLNIRYRFGALRGITKSGTLVEVLVFLFFGVSLGISSVTITICDSLIIVAIHKAGAEFVVIVIG